MITIIIGMMPGARIRLSDTCIRRTENFFELEQKTLNILNRTDPSPIKWTMDNSNSEKKNR